MSTRNLLARRAALVTAAGLLVGFACTRQADLPEPPGTVTVPTANAPEAGDVVTVDSAFGTDAYPACAERPEGDCRGPIDFTCKFEPWVRAAADACQMQTTCKTNGWIAVVMDDDGCVSELGMEQPDDDFVGCMVEALGGYRCPCHTVDTTYWLGEGHTGVCPDSGPLK